MNTPSMTTKTTAIVTGTLLAFGMALPAFALLDANVSVNANAGTGSTTLGVYAAANLSTRIANGKSHAEQEITRRVTALNGLNNKIQAMIRVTADQKTAFAAEIQAQIGLMTSLQAKISADTDINTLKTDIKSITNSYRIFLLILPQININAAADKIQTTATAMTTLSGKLSTRINDAQTKGKDVTTLKVNLTDMDAKIADANVQAAAAVSETANLKPDNGDATIAASNKSALKDARTKLETARADLKTARQDAGTIVKALKAMHLDASATSSTSVGTQ